MQNELSIFNPQNIDNLPMATRWAIQKQGGDQIKEVMLNKICEDGRAYIVNAAMENTGTLSALEQHLSQVTPQASERYKHLVDAYVMGAANRIARY